MYNMTHQFNKYECLSFPDMFKFITEMFILKVFSLLSYFARLHEINSNNHHSPGGNMSALSKRINSSKINGATLLEKYIVTAITALCKM